MELTCPKCQGAMRQYERSGITVDQCTECRGVFLDRGELERLVDAENAWAASQAQAPPPGPPPGQPQYQQQYDRRYEHRDHDRDYDRDRDYGRHQGYGHGYGQPRRKKSFLEEIFG